MESPYSLINMAFENMRTMILDFPEDKEASVIKMINSAETYPDMSAYQIMQARIMLIDLYISHNIYGNAYDLCEIVLEKNPKAPIKKKLRKLEISKKENPEMFTYSCDLQMVDSKLCYLDETRSDLIRITKNNATPSTREELIRNTIEEVIIESETNNNIYDPEWEEEISERLSKLGEPYYSEFYRLRDSKKYNGFLPKRKKEELMLRAMEKSYKYRNS